MSANVLIINGVGLLLLSLTLPIVALSFVTPSQACKGSPSLSPGVDSAKPTHHDKPVCIANITSWNDDFVVSSQNFFEGTYQFYESHSLGSYYITNIVRRYL